VTSAIAILTFTHEEKEQRDERYAAESQQRAADHRRGRTAEDQYDGPADNRQQCETSNNSRYHGDNLPHERSVPTAVVHPQGGSVSRRLI
jgi:hypothetical protein